MSKKASLLFLSLLFAGALFFSDTLQSPLLSLLARINNAWLDLTTFVSETYDEHIYQRDEIVRLRAELEHCRQSHLLSHEMATEFNALLDENNASFRPSPAVALVRSNSYADMGDFNKLWLTFPDFNRSKLYGLIYNETTAGIVTERNGRPLAMLNGDPQCTYAVSVGPSRAPGIIRGLNGDTMLVEFIPAWIAVSVGDEVVTSGLDQLFFNGIRVGKVTAVELHGGYQNAVVSPYFTPNMPDYFHVITKVR